MTTVSVITPVYNGEKYLAECLDSVLAQTLPDIEIICVDDGSQDSTLAILEKYSSAHPNIKIFRQKNLGPGIARNLALDNATGKYVAFMDADDRYPDSGALKYLWKLAEGSGCKVAGGYLRLFAADATEEECAKLTEGWLKRNRYPELGVIKFADYQSPLGYQRYIFSREMLDGAKIRFKNFLRFEDPPFCAEALHCAGKMAVSDRVVYDYRRGNHGIDWAGEGGLRARHFLEGHLAIQKFALSSGYTKLASAMAQDFVRTLPPDAYDIPEVKAAAKSLCECIAAQKIAGVVLQRLVESVARLESERKLFRKDRDSSREKASRLVAERDEAREKAARLVAERDEARAALREKGEAFAKERDSAREKVARLVAERDEARATMREKGEAFAKERDEARAKVARLVAERDEARAALREKGEAFAKERDEARAKVARLVAERDEARAALREKGEAFAKERDEARAKVARLVAERDEARAALREKGEAFAKERDEARAKVEALRKQRDEAREKIEALRKQRDEARAKAATILEQRNLERGKSKEQREKFDKLASEHKDLKRKDDKISRDLDAANKTLSALKDCIG